jgi:Fe(3+) dicitrate transport protein
MGILYKINEDYNVYKYSQRLFLQGKRWRRCSSINSELGFRPQKYLYGELIGYYNNFSNLGIDNMSGGGTGTGDLFNAGAAIKRN